MIIPDRRKQILDILEEEGEINTTVLSTRLGVTGATIRTDIRALEREGAIVRFHGGIKLPHKMPSYSGENYMVRAVTHVDLKNAIGAKAATLVGSGNTIFMDASSTTFHMIPYLKKVKDVTVITNGIHTAMELQRNSNFKSIIILGGMLRPHSGAIEGLSSKGFQLSFISFPVMVFLPMPDFQVIISLSLSLRDFAQTVPRRSLH